MTSKRCCSRQEFQPEHGLVVKYCHRTSRVWTSSEFEFCCRSNTGEKENNLSEVPEDLLRSLTSKFQLQLTLSVVRSLDQEKLSEDQIKALLPTTQSPRIPLASREKLVPSEKLWQVGDVVSCVLSLELEMVHLFPPLHHSVISTQECSFAPPPPGLCANEK